MKKEEEDAMYGCLLALTFGVIMGVIWPMFGGGAAAIGVLLLLVGHALLHAIRGGE